MRHLPNSTLIERQAAVDRFISSWIEAYAGRGGQIFCGKGCRNCCTLAVNCTFPEALLIAASLDDEQESRVSAHAARTRRLIPEMTDLKSFLKLHRQEIGICPLLNSSGECGIYPIRPFSCRSLLATKESSWCAADFSLLSQAEKIEFMESLDREVVSFPMHYVAATQGCAQEYEALTLSDMAKTCGFSLYGNLPVLLHLERSCLLSEVVLQGYDATVELLESQGMHSPLIVMIEESGSPRS
jgi:Fe-S-cluster containining protein